MGHKALITKGSRAIWAAALFTIVVVNSAGWSQEPGVANGSGDECIARFVNGVFTFITIRGRVDGYELRLAYYFTTSQFSGNGTNVGGYANSAFTVPDNKLQRLWTRATALRNVTDLAVSQDGSKVAYLNRPGPKSEEAVLGVLGETFDPRPLAPAGARGFDRTGGIGWDPEGKRIVFESFGSVATIDADGQQEKEIIGPGCAPSWSPDGRVISYRDNDGYGMIYDVRERSLRRLRFVRSHCAAFYWSPDSRLAFTDETGSAARFKDCYTNDRFVIYRMKDGYRQGRYDPCGLRAGTFGWIRDVAQWRAAVVGVASNGFD